MTCRENLRTLGSTRDLSLLEKVANRPPLARPAQVGGCSGAKYVVGGGGDDADYIGVPIMHVGPTTLLASEAILIL